jgi:hypothetical protein
LSANAMLPLRDSEIRTLIDEKFPKSSKGLKAAVTYPLPVFDPTISVRFENSLVGQLNDVEELDSIVDKELVATARDELDVTEEEGRLVWTPVLDKVTRL